MAILIEQYPVPEAGMLEINIQQTFRIHVTAEEAKRKVHFWLVTEVSNLIGAESPILVIVNQRAVWRVPAWIGFPRHGRLGTVGTIDVDVETGELNKLPECKAAIEQRAQKLAAILPPYRPRQTVPPECLVPDAAPAPMAHLLADEQNEMVAFEATH